MVKAKAKNTAKTPSPVAERGVPLLNRMFTEGGLYLTQTEAKDELAASNITVNRDDMQGDRALCMLTEKGRALVTVSGNKTDETEEDESAFEIEDDYEMPEETAIRRGGKRASKYPFDKLEIGQSFHIPKTDKMPDPVQAIASSITQARRRFSEPVFDTSGKPVMVNKKVKTYALAPDGKRVRQADNSWIVTGEAVITEQKTRQTRDFFAIPVGPGTAHPDDKKGAGARVFRKKL